MKTSILFALILTALLSDLENNVAWAAAPQPLKLMAWGASYAHQTEIPPGVGDFIDVSCGYQASVALTADGRVVAWGNEVSGQTSSASVLPGVISVVTSGTVTAALKSDGRVAWWVGHVSDRFTIEPELNDGVALVSSLHNNIAVLKKNGTVHVLLDLFGYHGPILGLSNVVSAAWVGEEYLLALRSDGTLTNRGYMWNQGPPTPALSNVTAIASRTFYPYPFGNYSMALTSDGRVVAWNSGGGLYSDVPSDLADVKAIAGGAFVSLALKTDGTVVAWGGNESGVIDVPANLFGVRKISVGLDHALALYDASPGVYRATGTALLEGDRVLRVMLTNTGFGYTNPPVVRFVGGGGAGAKATAVIANGLVKSIVIDDGGIGYTNAPEVRIASATKPPELTMKVSKVILDLKLILGSTYQIFSSKDLVAWGRVGNPFVAEDEKLSQEFDAIEVGQYFRVIELP